MSSTRRDSALGAWEDNGCATHGGYGISGIPWRYVRLGRDLNEARDHHVVHWRSGERDGGGWTSGRRERRRLSFPPSSPLPLTRHHPQPTSVDSRARSSSLGHLDLTGTRRPNLVLRPALVSMEPARCEARCRSSTRSALARPSSSLNPPTSRPCTSPPTVLLASRIRPIRCHWTVVKLHPCSALRLSLHRPTLPRRSALSLAAACPTLPSPPTAPQPSAFSITKFARARHVVSFSTASLHLAVLRTWRSVG